MATKHLAIMGRSDVYKVDPKGITIKENWNPRRDMGEIGVLRESIKEMGVLVPLTVAKDSDGNLSLINGERRLQCVLELLGAGIEESANGKMKFNAIPCIMASYKDGVENLMAATLATNEGKPLTYIELGRGMSKLAALGVEQKDIAKKVGRDASYVSRCLKIFNEACPVVKSALENGIINITITLEILKEAGTDPIEQEKVLRVKMAEMNSPTKKEKKESANVGDSSLFGGTPRRSTMSMKELSDQITIADDSGDVDIARGLKIAARIEPKLEKIS